MTFQCGDSQKRGWRSEMRLLLALCILTVNLHAQAQGSTADIETLLRQHRAAPGDWRVCHQIALAYTQLEQFDKARDYYQRALKLNPTFLPARKNLGTVLWFLGKKQESEREFQRVVKSAPKDPVPHLYLGLAQYERKNFVSARSHFVSAGDLAFRNPEVLPAVLETYLATKDTAVAAKLLGLLQQAERPDPQLVLRVASVLATYGKYAEAIESLEKIASSGDAKPEVYLLLAEAYDKKGEPQKAYEAYTKSIRVAPRSEESYVGLAAFASVHKNDEFALRIVTQGLEHLPGSPRLLLMKGVYAALLGKAEEARQSLLEAGKADPKSSMPHLALGVSHLERGNYDEAAGQFRRAAEISPDDFRAEYLYATALRRSGSPADREKIIAAFERAARLKPDDPRPHASLGQAYFESGRLKEAAAELEKALALDSENTTALYQLGLLYRDLGRPEDSGKMLRRFRESKTRQQEEQEGELVQMLKVVKE